MEKCLTCKNVCEKAGTNENVCRRYSPLATAKIKVNSLYSFPKRIIVESAVTGKQEVFIPVDMLGDE